MIFPYFSCKTSIVERLFLGISAVGNCTPVMVLHLEFIFYAPFCCFEFHIFGVLYYLWYLYVVPLFLGPFLTFYFEAIFSQYSQKVVDPEILRHCHQLDHCLQSLFFRNAENITLN